KFPYTKTQKFEKIYCNMYPDKFNCKNIGSYSRGMFPDDFNLSDVFFIKLSIRPVGWENYNALNIAGLYLRNKRPGKDDTTYEYTFLDIELDYLIKRVYFQNDALTAMHDDVVQFKLAFLSLVEENLFLITDKIYVNELAACNNFKGPYYEASRRFFTDALHDLLEIEKNEEVLNEINNLLNKISAK
ncbi:MAG: hypothetical protein JXB24_15085, partial [Bacteroidales bacterium]|nr:hypothetical protein [Bacteroidales bacterium]